MAANKATAAKTRTKKKERKNISAGAAHIQSTFNNTIEPSPTPRATPFPGAALVR